MACIDQKITDRYALYNGDCCEVLPSLPDGSIHLSIYSPPFCGLYNYSSSERDMSNCRTYGEFFAHYEYLVRELHRVTMPGCITAVHCMDIPGDGANTGGGLIDFTSDIRKLHTRCRNPECKADEYPRDHGLCGHGWFQYAARYHVWKEPLGVRNRTMAKGLAHKQLVDDSSLCDVAAADYLLMFRKEGKRATPIAHPEGLSSYAGEREVPHELWRYKGWKGKQTENRLSHWIWRQYASAFWDDVRIDRVLPYKESRDPEDEKHCHPLQLDVIERGIVLWSNPGETVLTPFMGVGSEVYGAVINGRKAIGVELKPAYYRQAVRNVVEGLQQADCGDEQLTIFDEIENAEPAPKMDLPQTHPVPLELFVTPESAEASENPAKKRPKAAKNVTPTPAAPENDAEMIPECADTQGILYDSVGGYDVAKARGCLAFAKTVKSLGQSREIETGGNLDIAKCARLCNAILRGVASIKPIPTAEQWDFATGYVEEYFGIENVSGAEWIPLEHRK